MMYEKPKLTMADKTNRVSGQYPNELYYFDVDRERGEVVVSCCFERIAPWEYLAGIGTPVISRYVEELNDKVCFRRLSEPREICRIECDVDDGDSALDLNNCDPWQFPVRNESRWDDWLEEIMGEELEEFNACDRDSLYPKRLAVRKGGLWWIIQLETMEIWETCFRSLDPLTSLQNESLVLAEDEKGVQYGLFLNGFDDQCTNLQGDDWNEEIPFEEPWTRVCHVDGNLVLLERVFDGKVINRRLMDGFERVVAEDTLEDLRNGEGFTVSGYPMVWVETRGEVTILDVADSAFQINSMWGEEYVGSYELVDRLGSACVLRKHLPGPGAYRAVKDHIFVPGTWDDARVMKDRYQEAYAFLVKKDGLWGVVDQYGEVLVPIRFAAICQIAEEGEDILLELDNIDSIRTGRLRAEPRPAVEGTSLSGFDFGEGWCPGEKETEFSWVFRLDPIK